MEDTPDVYEKLMGAALRFVSYRPRSIRELRAFLHKTLKRHHTTAPVVVDSVMERLTELGYADDEAFIHWWVQQRSSAAPRGKRVIVLELIGKGIPRELAERYVAGHRDTEAEFGLAKQVAGKRRTRLFGLQESERRRKLYAYLLRRGFTSEIALRVVDDTGTKE